MEIILAAVKGTSNLWTQGDIYFGTGQAGQIGWLAADASSSNLNWLTLSGETNAIGGLYIDQTGVFGGDLIVVTGDDPSQPGSDTGGGVWRVKHDKTSTKVAQITRADGTGTVLEGVVTVPNDANKYGPWAGKILTCGENTRLIYAVETNGTVTAYNLGLGTPEDVVLIPSGQNLYCLDESNDRVLKVTQDNFANFVGDILLVDEGVMCSASGVDIVHWTGGGFLVRKIPVGSSLDQVTFAPIDLPALP